MLSSPASLDEQNQTILDSGQTQRPSKEQLSIRLLQREDAQALHALIRNCPPLDVNSLYAYSLLANHFADTCVVAMDGDTLCGVVTGYIKPAQPDTYFLWQVAVSNTHQGLGIGSMLLNHVLSDLMQPRQLKFLETTISPSNQASQNLFTRFAARHGVACQVEEFLSSEELQPLDDTADEHEAEMLYRIGAW